MRTLAIVAAPLLVLGSLLLGEAYVEGNRPAPAAPATLPRPGFGPADYAAALVFVEGQLAGWRESVAQAPGEWLPHAGLGHALGEYAALTGDFAALVEAQSAMAQARLLAPDNAGPTLEAAHSAMAAHRLDLAEAALALMARSVVPEGPEAQSEAIALRGDIAFYRGDMAGAEQLFEESHAVAAGPGSRYRLAILAKARGQFDEAATLFSQTLGSARQTTPETVANIALQRGAVEQARGRYDAALGWFRQADAIFPGHWLIEAHVAQGEYLTGAHTAAIARLERMDPARQPVEVMELYALLLGEQGRMAESRRWAARAAAIWDERLALLPAASYGHAIEHQLRFGTPQRALDLAARNLALRPYGEARLLMAEALLANDRPAEALAQIRAARAAGWHSAPHLRAEVYALEALGRTGEARRLRVAAVAINPHVFEAVSELVWLSHG